MPAWITPLLCVLVSIPGRGWRSSTPTDAPPAALAPAPTRPVTPPPTTAAPADLLDQLSIIGLVDEVRPSELYNLAAMSFVPASWDQPMLTGEFNAQGVTRVLEAIRHVDSSIKIYQASSSEMFGKVRQIPQSELTPFYPRSPNGVSKVFA